MAGPNDPRNPQPRPGVAGIRPTSAPVGVQAPRPARAAVAPGAPTAPAAPAVAAPASAVAPAAPQASPTPSIGVPGGGNLPTPGVKYPAAQEFEFPAGYGHAYVEQGGQRTYSHSSPAQLASFQSTADAYNANRRAEEQHSMIRDAHATMQSMMLGANGRYGGLAPEERANAIGVLSSQIGGLSGIEAQRHAADLQFGNDPHRDPAYRQALIGHMRSQADAESARALKLTSEADDAAHPERQLDMMKQILADPQLGPRYLAMKGVSAADQGAFPPVIEPGRPGEPGVHAGNLGAVLGQQKHAGLAKLFDDTGKDGLDLGEVIARASQYPGFADTGSQTRQAFDAWIKQKYAGSPGQWTAEMDGPPRPPQGGFEWWAKRGLGLLNQLGDPRTGYSWDSNYDQAQRRIGLINKYKVSPY